MRASLILCALILASCFAYPQSSDAGEGIITGKVLDQHGQPMAKATVCHFISHDGGESGTCPVNTDDSGAFRLEHLPLRTYQVSAFTHATCTSPNQKESQQTVALSADNQSANIVLKLAVELGTIKLHATNKLTGESVTPLMVRWAIEDPAHGTRQETGSGNGNRPQEAMGGLSRWSPGVCVPPNKNVRLEISANGYHTWLYTDPANPSRPQVIRLEPGEEKTLEMQLDPWTEAEKNEKN